MTAHELTELALRIERLRDEVGAIRDAAPCGGVSAALDRAGVELHAAVQSLGSHIGRAVVAEARGSAA